MICLMLCLLIFMSNKQSAVNYYIQKTVKHYIIYITVTHKSSYMIIFWIYKLIVCLLI